jgi:hypothetical protein
LQIAAASNRFYVVLLAGNRGRTATPFNRPLLIDANFTVLDAGNVGASGSTTYRLPIPNDATLRHRAFFAQHGDFSQSLDVHLSNSIEIFVD